MRYFQVDCSTCTLCCTFFLDVGKKLSLATLTERYPFDKEMCDLYFVKKKGAYIVGETCRHLRPGNKCALHKDPRRHISCMLYPLVLCRRRSKIALCIDQNCPEAKKYLAANHLSDVIAAAKKILSHYERQIYMPTITELRNCGYELSVLQTDLEKTNEPVS